MEIVIFIIIAYILFTLFVHKKINQAHYLKEERRRLHQKLIWFLPFLGLWMLRSFWMKQKQKKPKVMTRSRKKADNSMVGKALGMMGIGFTGGDIIDGGGGADGGGGFDGGGGGGDGGGGGVG